MYSGHLPYGFPARTHLLPHLHLSIFRYPLILPNVRYPPLLPQNLLFQNALPFVEVLSSLFNSHPTFQILIGTQISQRTYRVAVTEYKLRRKLSQLGQRCQSRLCRHCETKQSVLFILSGRSLYFVRTVPGVLCVLSGRSLYFAGECTQTSTTGRDLVSSTWCAWTTAPLGAG